MPGCVYPMRPHTEDGAGSRRIASADSCDQYSSRLRRTLDELLGQRVGETQQDLLLKAKRLVTCDPRSRCMLLYRLAHWLLAFHPDMWNRTINVTYFNKLVKPKTPRTTLPVSPRMEPK